MVIRCRLEAIETHAVIGAALLATKKKGTNGGSPKMDMGGFSGPGTIHVLRLGPVCRRVTSIRAVADS